MATFFLVRHAAHDLLGRVLAGRTAGVRLSEVGRAQAERLAGRLAREGVDAVESGPLERTRETAEPIGRGLGLPVEVRAEIDEIDFGAWNGCALEALADDPRWGPWNVFRSGNRAPGGESMTEAQARIVGHMDRLRMERPGARVVLVSHGDVIKAALAHYLGVPLDLFLRIEISPASVSVVEIGDYGPRILGVNETVCG